MWLCGNMLQNLYSTIKKSSYYPTQSYKFHSSPTFSCLSFLWEKSNSNYLKQKKYIYISLFLQLKTPGINSEIAGSRFPKDDILKLILSFSQFCVLCIGFPLSQAHSLRGQRWPQAACRGRWPIHLATHIEIVHSFSIVSASPRIESPWPDLGPMSVCGPFTSGQENGIASWPSLGHVKPSLYLKPGDEDIPCPQPQNRRGGGGSLEERKGDVSNRREKEALDNRCAAPRFLLVYFLVGCRKKK